MTDKDANSLVPTTPVAILPDMTEEFANLVELTEKFCILSVEIALFCICDPDICTLMMRLLFKLC